MSDNPPAFPLHPRIDPNWKDSQSLGMSIRDWFAGQALPAVVEMVNIDVEDRGEKLPMPMHEMFAVVAYQIADAMLAARKSGQPS